MNVNTKLSVIIPCWNCENEIAQMLDCILQQSFQDWQVICVDDQSTDNTLHVLQDYLNKDNRIHCIVRNRDPKGAQACRNIGFDLSEGAEYVIWFDADDLISPYCFEQRVSYMERHPNLDFGVFPAKTFKNDIWDKDKVKCYGFPFFEDSLGALLNWTITMVGWTNIYRRTSLVLCEHKWDEKIQSMQDSDFNIQSIIKGLKYNYAVIEGAKVDYFHRLEQNKCSVSHGIHTIPHFDSHIYYLRKITESLSKEQKKKYKENLQLYFLSFAEILAKAPSYYNKLLSISWVKNYYSFYIRLKLWAVFGFRFGHKLFLRDILKKRNVIWESWKKQMKNQTHDIIANKN